MVSSGDDEKYSKFTYILDLRLRGHANGLNMGIEGKKIQVDSELFALNKQLGGSVQLTVIGKTRGEGVGGGEG